MNRSTHTWVHTPPKSKAKDFSYTVQDGLEQVTKAVETVHVVNVETEERLRSLINCLDQSEASLVLFYMCVISQ